MSDINRRIVFIDLLRIVAIVNVLLCHATEAIYSIDAQVVRDATVYSRLFRIVSHSCGRIFGVPLFLMITGYLLLGKEYSDDGIRRFWKNNLLHLFICTEVWLLIYDLFMMYYEKRSLLWSDVIKDLLFIRSNDFSHVWYMPMIIGFYLFIPFASNAIIKIKDDRLLMLPFAIIFLFKSVSVFVNLCIRISGGQLISPQLSEGFSGGIYGLYISAGYLLKRKWSLERKHKISLLIVITGILFSSAYFVNTCIYSNTDYFLWYDFPLVIISSALFFLLISQCKFNLPESIGCIITWLSKYTFAVYLIHNIIRYFVDDYIKSMSITDPLKVILMECVMLVGGYLAAFIISRIPVVGKYVLYVK